MPTITEVDVARRAGQLVVHVTVAAPTDLTLRISSEGRASDGHATITLLAPPGRHEFVTPPFSFRHRVTVTSSDGEQRRVPERALCIDGVRNFRDVGGYPAAAGGRVRWGCVYRSADLDSLSRAGLAALRTLGIKTLIDFRGAAERKPDPSIPLDSELRCKVLHLPIIPQHGEPPGEVGAVNEAGPSIMENIFGRGERGQWTPAQLRHAFEVASFLASRTVARSYLSFLVSSMESLRETFTRLAAPDGLPSIIQCAAGKDRTGVVCAILLSVLGVKREDVVEDYLLSNTHWAEAELAPYGDRLGAAGIAPADLFPLFGVSAPSIRKLLTTLDDTYGGAAHYLTEFLGVEVASVERLRDSLTASN